MMKQNNKRLILTLLSVMSFVSVYSQSKEELEQKRLRLIKEIEQTNKYLESTQKNKAATLSDIKAVQSKVENRRTLISTIKDEIKKSDDLMLSNMNRKDSLENDLKDLENQYAEIVRIAYLQKMSTNKWMFLLSSENMRTFLLRWRYVDQFSKYEAIKKEEIQSINAQIQASNEEISSLIANKQTLLKTEEEQVKTLENEKGSKDKMLKTIVQKEGELKKDLAQQQKERQKLNLEIEKIIAAQVKENATAKNSDKTLSTEITKLSADFQTNKNKLPWPIDQGFVSSRFGTQPHPTIRGVTIENNGIDISANGKKNVKSIFDGEVVGVAPIPGYKNMIIVNHGNFYTVYSNIETVNVSKGDAIKAGQQLGIINPDEENRSELHFEIWKEKTKLNPESWLRG